MSMTNPGGRSVAFQIDFVTRGYQQAAAQVQNFAQVTQQATGQITRMNRGLDPGRLFTWALGWTAVYRAIRLFEQGISDSIQSAFELDRAMRNVNAIAKLNERQLAALTSEVVELSTATGAGFRPMRELAGALYSINSAGIIGAKSMDVLKASSMAAAAGLTDAGTAATAIVSVINAYGLSAGEAARVSDILFKTVEVGVPPFEQLAKNIGEVAATSAIAKVPIEELGLVWAALSRVLTSASETTTSMNRVVTSFLAPTAAMNDAVAQLGYTSAQALLEQRGLIGALRELYKITGDDAVKIRELFDDVRAFRGAAPLMRGELKLLTDTMRDWGKVGGEAGATNRALAEQMKSQSTEVDRLRREYERLKLELGRGVVPALANVASNLADVIAQQRKFREFGPAWLTPFGRQIGGTVGGFVAPDWVNSWEVNARLAGRRTPSELQRITQARLMAGLDPITGQRPGEAGAPAPARPTRAPAPQTLAELERIFERHRTLQEFTTAGEVRALSQILIPRAEAEYKTALQRKNVEAIEKAADNLVRLESRRLELAQDLAQQYRQQGQELARALKDLRDVEVEAAEVRLSGFTRNLSLALEPLKQFRDLMGEALDPMQARRFREEIQRLSLQQINAEIATLQRLMQTEPDSSRRIGFAQQLQDALQRRAGLQAGFLVETRQAEFADLQQRLARMREALAKEFDPFGPRGGFFREQIRQMQLELKRLGQRPDISEKDISEPYRRAAEEIAKIQAGVVDPALRKSQDAARGIARAALDATLTLRDQIIQAWGSMGAAAVQAFMEAFRKGLPEDIRKALGIGGGGAGTAPQSSAITAVQSVRLPGGEIVEVGPGTPGWHGTPPPPTFSQLISRQQGGMATGTGPHILHEGEFVLPKAVVEMLRTRSTDGGGRTETLLGAILSSHDRLVRLQEKLVEGRSPLGGQAVMIHLNNVDLTSLVGEQTKQELVGAVMSVAGDRAVQSERRFGTAGQVA